uniref:Chemosensory protein n=1 Tax=Leucinodes orbonalis TaxID=711050 RepID=A0AAU0QK94_9NEOP|nr:chemosensory protein [Leucinodes orbonalis]
MLYLAVIISSVLMDPCLGKLHNYDNFDVEYLLSNSTRSKSFFECVSDEAKCTNQEDKELKQDMVEMVSTSCANCTEKEKKKFAEAMKALQQSMRDSQVIKMFINKITDMFQGGFSSDGEKSS